MIKFFRKIRQKLLSENKFSKYLIYAIGEIILVVIGILIALQINTYYENKKKLTEEIQTLTSLKNALKKDSSFIKRFAPFYKDIKTSMDIVSNYLDSDITYQDSLSSHFGNMLWNGVLESQKSEFESLKSRDIKLISNEELRSKIIEYYSGVERLEKDHDTYLEIIVNALNNIFPSRFYSINSSYHTFINSPPNFGNLKIELTPINPLELKNDNEFKFFITNLKMQRNWYMDYPEHIIKGLNTALIKNIDEELKLLKRKSY